MKKLFVFAIISVLALSLAACGNNLTGGESGKTSGLNSTTSNNNTLQSGTATDISRERALEIALDKAGVKQADIRDLHIELDNERGVLVWEVDFEHGNLEYSYDVNAKTGDITKAERERDY